MSSRRSSAVSSTASPARTRTSPARPSRVPRAARTASPVPRGFSCTATAKPSKSSLRLRCGDDDHRIGAGVDCRRQHPVDHAPAEHRMEELRDGRAHPRAEPGGHDDCCDRGICHSGRVDGWGARIRTWDRGTKTRCLTAWLRPRERIHSRRPPRGTVRAYPSSSDVNGTSPTARFAVPSRDQEGLRLARGAARQGKSGAGPWSGRKGWHDSAKASPARGRRRCRRRRRGGSRRRT